MLELCGVVSLFAVALLLAAEVYRGASNFGYLWLLPVVAILAYLIADLLSGLVHFLADNFGSAETPLIGPNFVGAFREHHVDPKGITRHDFIDTNGNNSLASLPFMVFVWLLVPVETAAVGYLVGTFSLLLCLAVFLTNQFQKWAHMEEPPSVVAWLQERGMILSREHHDVHHESPYNTYYCITVGSVAHKFALKGQYSCNSARAEKRSAERRKEIAKRAAEARWAKKRQQEEPS